MIGSLLGFASLLQANNFEFEKINTNLSHYDTLPTNLNTNQLKQYAQQVNSNSQELADKINATNQKELENPLAHELVVL